MDLQAISFNLIKNTFFRRLLRLQLTYFLLKAGSSGRGIFTGCRCITNVSLTVKEMETQERHGRKGMQENEKGFLKKIPRFAALNS